MRTYIKHNPTHSSIKIISLLILIFIQYNSTLAHQKESGITIFSSSEKYPTGNDSNKDFFKTNNQSKIRLPIDLISYKGMRLLLSFKLKKINNQTDSDSTKNIKYRLENITQKNEIKQILEKNISVTNYNKTYNSRFVIPNQISENNLFLEIINNKASIQIDSLTLSIDAMPISPSAKSKNKIKNKTVYRGVTYPLQTNENDLKELKDWGGNLIRTNITIINQEKLIADTSGREYMQVLNKKIDKLIKLLSICQDNKIKVVLSIGSDNYKEGQNKRCQKIFYDKTYQNLYIKVWQQIASRCKKNKNMWAYDLINEPIDNHDTIDENDYYQTQTRIAKAIRAIDPITPIIFEVNVGDGPIGFTFLKPLPIPNIIYEVHMYIPHTFTHQGIYGNRLGIIYPGKIDGSNYNKNTLEKILEPVRNFQLAYNKPIYVGEFSAIRWSQGASQYIDDCISIFEEYGWDWTYHAFKEWNGWDVEYENGTSNSSPAKKATEDTERKKVLLKWLSKNKK